MTTIGAYSTSLLNSASQGYATTTAQPSLAQVLDEQNSDSSSSSSTNVTLSDAAKSYLASMQDAAATGDSADVSLDTLAATILRLQGDGDYAGVGAFYEKYGTISPTLQHDLDRIATKGIPVDVVFEQGGPLGRGTK